MYDLKVKVMVNKIKLKAHKVKIKSRCRGRFNFNRGSSITVQEALREAGAEVVGVVAIFTWSKAKATTCSNKRIYHSIR